MKSYVICLAIPFLAASSLTTQAQSTSKKAIWSDEFNGKTINRNTWTYDVGGHGFGNGQLEYNTASSSNSYIKDGKLVIEARREKQGTNAFTSARMLTQGRFAFQYGALEARIKVPYTANGIWPAFWLLGNNFPAVDWPKSGEIDILEIGGKDGIAAGLQRRKINCALHFAGKDSKKTSLVSWFDAPVDLDRDFHRYRVEWTPSQLKFFLDDQEYGSWDITDPTMREFHQPCFILLNLAVGSWVSSYTAVDTPDKVTAKLPARMEVDWIRLYPNSHTKVVLGNTRQEEGPFGVFTEANSMKSSLTYGQDSNPEFAYGQSAAVLKWNNIADADVLSKASEGKDCWSWQIEAGKWFGTGVFLSNHRNMTKYSDGYLHFDIKTDSLAKMRIGIKSSRGGEFWLPLGDEEAEFGFARDDKWHTVSIPLNRFANTDFATIHQMFMLAGDPPKSSFHLSVDNIWWEPSGKRPAPKGSEFGIYTENAKSPETSFVLGKSGNFFVWEKTMTQTSESPFEGKSCLHLKQAPGASWSGAAFTPNVKHDLRALAKSNARLRFAMKTDTKATFRIGMKSGNVDGVGQKWITFKPGEDPYNFRRDGKWHVIEVPLSEFAKDVDLSQVSQLFQVLSSNGPISEISFDDIRILAPPAR